MVVVVQQREEGRWGRRVREHKVMYVVDGKCAATPPLPLPMLVGKTASLLNCASTQVSK